MNVITFCLKDVSFLRVDKFLRELTGRQAAELYALLREQRNWLVDYKKIRGYKDWFFYPKKKLQSDLLPPNSPNHILKLLKQLEDHKLINIRVDDNSVKWYQIDDDVFFRLAQDETKKYSKKIEKEFDEMPKDESDSDPLGYNTPKW